MKQKRRISGDVDLPERNARCFHRSLDLNSDYKINTNCQLSIHSYEKKHTYRTTYPAYQPFLYPCFGILLHRQSSEQNMKRLYLLPGSVFLLLWVSCSTHSRETEREQTVRTDTVVPADTRTLLQFPGKVKAAQDINLAFRVSGTIHQIYVKEGASVREGQLLAELDPTDYQVQLDATEAEYLQVKAEAERVMALYQEHGTTPNAYDKAVYGLQQITAKYKHHQDQLAYTRLYAPFDGYIQKRLFEAHETVSAGMPVLSLLGAGAPEVEINLPAAEYIRRDRFIEYHCTFDLFPGKEFPLKPISLSPKANANQLYTMRLQIGTNKQESPSPGINTTVSIRCRTDEENTFSVPAGAIWQADGKTYVFVYEPSDRTVHRCEVSLLRLLGNGRSVVASDRLKPGVRVVSSGVHHLRDGERVKLLPSATGTNVGGLM